MPSRQHPLAVQQLANVIGDRGENIFELAITDYAEFKSPLFKPSFLGDKWPAVDYYVELLGVRLSNPFFFVQVKSTTKPIAAGAEALEILVPPKKCQGLFRIPGPTYIVGVHEPTRRAFILSIHLLPTQGVYRIHLKYELTPDNLKALHQEVQSFWQSFPNKPQESKFK